MIGFRDGASVRRRLLLVLIGAGLSWLEVLGSSNAEPAVLAVDVFAGLSLIAAAAAFLGRDTGRRIGIICAVTGIAWFCGAFTPLLEGAYVGPLGQLIVAYPTGRIRRGAATLVVVGGYLAGFAMPFAAVDVRGIVLPIVALVAAAGAARTRGPLRRGRMSGALTGVVIAAVAMGTSTESQGWLEFEVARIVYASVVGIGAIWLAVDLRWGGWSQDALARLVIDLGDRAEPSTLRARLAEVLDDPTLVIGYRVGAGTSYVDDAGLPVAVALPGSDRIAVPLVSGGVEVGVLVRDARTETDPLLADGVARAAELALANARLNAAAQLRLRELDASRARLIAAEETERSRIRFELDSGALSRLAIVEDRLAHERESETSRKLLREVRAVIAQLEEFGRGLGPSDLPAVGPERCAPPARRSRIGAGDPHDATRFAMGAGRRVDDVLRGGRGADEHRPTCWARPRHRSGSTTMGGSVRLEIVDDGIGGAAPSSGSGSRGPRPAGRGRGWPVAARKSGWWRNPPDRRAAGRS